MRTKIVGYLLILLAVLGGVVDLLDGGGFDVSKHYDSIVLALNGAGFIFLRSAVQKVENKQ